MRGAVDDVRLDAGDQRGSDFSPPDVVNRAAGPEQHQDRSADRAEAAVATAFVLHTARDDRLAGLYREQRAALLTVVRTQFEHAELSDPEQRANLLLQALEGMRTDCLLPCAGAVDIDATLERLLNA